MKMKIFVVFALALCACAAEVKEKQDKTEHEQNKDKRQAQGEFVPSLPVHLLYRTSRKQDPVAPVEEPQDDDRLIISSRADAQEYRPGQVFSLNPQELLDLQPERKAPLSSNQQLQQLYTSPQQDHRQNLQQIYYLEPQTARQVGAQSGSSTVAPLASYQQSAPYQQPAYQQSPQPPAQQSLQQLILQAFGGQQVGAQVPPVSTPAPLLGNPTSHQLSNYPQQDRSEYLRQLINLHALLNRQNASPTLAPAQYSNAPPQYSNAPPQYSSVAPPQYSTVAPHYYSQNVQPQYPQNAQPQYPQNAQPQYPQNAQPQYPQNAQPQYPQNAQPQYPQNVQPQYSQNAQPQYQYPTNVSPQYSANALAPYSTVAPTLHSSNAPYTAEAARSTTAPINNNPQFEKQQVYYLQNAGGHIIASSTPGPVVLVGNRQQNKYTQTPQPRRPDLQQLLLLQALAQTTPPPPTTLAPAPFTSTQSLRQNYYDGSQQDGQQPVVLIGSTGRSLKPSTQSPLLDTTPIPSNRQLQELDSNEPIEPKLKQLYLINALQEKDSESLNNESKNATSGALPEINPRTQVENSPTPSNSTTKDEQVASHAVIARPHYSSNGGEASVGAALSVSDSGVNPPDSFDQELLALLGQPARPDAQTYQSPTASVAPQYQQVAPQTVAPQYQQIDRYLTKPSKKPTKLRPKVHSLVSPPQSSAAPQQYLIETTNVQQQSPPQYRPVTQPQRVPQALRYVPSQAFTQQALYERPESQGLKVVAAPKLQAQPQQGYRLLQSYAQPEAPPKQYRILEVPRAQAVRPEQRVPASSIERPVTYLKRYPDTEKMRAVKIYDPVPQEAPQQSAPLLGEQYYLRPVYRTNELRDRYQPAPSARPEQPRVLETSKPAHSAIYVSKNLAPKKVKPQPPKAESASEEQVEEQRGQSIEERRAQLPPPKNNRAYTPEEFAALVAAGYSVTPIPVAPLGHPGHPVHQVAQSRSSAENASASVPVPSQRRPLYARRHQRLHLSGDDAP